MASIDEIVIVVKSGSRLRFDDMLPGFHLYGTDVVLEAQEQGYRAFVFDGPVVHNSRYRAQVFDRSFFASYFYMRDKWRYKLPLLTCTVPVTRYGWPLYKRWLRAELRILLRRQQDRPRPRDVRLLAKQLGYQ